MIVNSQNENSIAGRPGTNRCASYPGLTASKQCNKIGNVKQIDNSVAIQIRFPLRYTIGDEIDKRCHIKQTQESVGIDIPTQVDLLDYNRDLYRFINHIEFKALC